MIDDTDQVPGLGKLWTQAVGRGMVVRGCTRPWQEGHLHTPAFLAGSRLSPKPSSNLRSFLRGLANSWFTTQSFFHSKAHHGFLTHFRTPRLSVLTASLGLGSPGRNLNLPLTHTHTLTHLSEGSGLGCTPGERRRSGRFRHVHWGNSAS